MPRRIHHAIDELHGVVTILVVAHRPATVRNADVICLLEGVRLVALGSWDQRASDTDGRFAGLLSAQRLDGMGDRRSSCLDPR